MKALLHILLLAGLVDVQGGEIPIANHSFENPSLADGGFVSGSGVLGWTGQGSEFGFANPNNGYFSGTTDGPGQSPIDGLNAAHVNGGSKLIYQDTNLIVQANTVYQLTVLAGKRFGVPFGGSVSLWGGGDLLIAGLPDPADGQFIASSLTYTSPPSGPLIGKLLRIEFTAAGGGQAWWDNVHLLSNPHNTACTPHKAVATAKLVNGIFVGTTLMDSGCGYTNPPTVSIEGGGGVGASARAFISDGRVTEIQVTNGGCCYTNTPTIVISSPPLIPTVSIAVSKVNVTQKVVPGWKYVLESSTNAVNWTPTGPPFVADSETIVTEFDVDTYGRFFRLLVVP